MQTEQVGDTITDVLEELDSNACSTQPMQLDEVSRS
jgi:hypothetical protein